MEGIPHDRSAQRHLQLKRCGVRWRKHDVYSDDPTVRVPEERTAALLGKKDAVYMVTGTMTNRVAIRAYTEPGDAVVFDQNAHVYLLGRSSGVSVRCCAPAASRRPRHLHPGGCYCGSGPPRLTNLSSTA